MTCGVTFTSAGTHHDEAEVLNTDYQPIRGLYAAGELLGGLFYFNYPGGKPEPYLGSGSRPYCGSFGGTRRQELTVVTSHGIRQFVRIRRCRRRRHGSCCSTFNASRHACPAPKADRGGEREYL